MARDDLSAARAKGLNDAREDQGADAPRERVTEPGRRAEGQAGDGGAPAVAVGQRPSD
jgi:hypothetical protein